MRSAANTALLSLLLVVFHAACGGAGGPSEDPIKPTGAGTGDGIGVAANTGGGDMDEDGIPDATDLCPEAAEVRNGVDDDDGCPETDLDRDGIVGSADKCPSDAEDLDGFMDDDGCPDVDGDKDGVADAIDQCPAELENLNNYEDSDGCPDTIPPPVRKFTGTIAGVEFKPNSSTLSKRSLPKLDEAAKVLVEFTSARIEIQGHTDNVGSRASNLKLSQKRADAVRMYLIEKGVVPTHIVAKGYGPDKPKADNKTKAGQAQNRRVEFVLINKN